MIAVAPLVSSNLPNEDIFYVGSLEHHDFIKRKFYERKIGIDAKIYKSQFLNVEDMLLQSFQFVSPASSNAKAYSTKFASVIKEAANIYELISRNLYTQFFTCSPSGQKQLKVFNYLALDARLNLSNQHIDSFLFYDTFDHSPEIYQPFKALEMWDKSSPLTSQHIPTWWTAYNKLKHTNEGLNVYATLEQAIAAVAAVFVMLHTVYGPGVVYGFLVDMQNILHTPPVSKVFTPM